MRHPRNVGWGEIGLDYHYDNSPRDVQREVFTQQLRHAVRLGKPITVHTREADEDTESILKAEVPKDHKVQQWFFFRCYRMGYDLIDFALTGRRRPHRYTFIVSPTLQNSDSAYWITSPICTSALPVCFYFFPRLVLPTDITSPAGLKIDVLPYFPQGVITFSSNENTSHLVRRMFATASQSSPPRVILETDAPFMIPANIYGSLPTVKGRLPLCHAAMIPWTAEVVAAVAGEGWDVDRVLELGKTNAHNVYGI